MRNLTHFPDDDPRTRTLATRMADPDRNARLNAIPDTDFDTLPLKALADKHDLPDLDPIETASVIGPRLDAKVKRAREEDARASRIAAKARQPNPLKLAAGTGDPFRAQNFDRAQSAPTGGLPNPGAGLRQGTVSTDAIFGKAPEAGRPPSAGTRANATNRNAPGDLNPGGNRRASGSGGIGERFAGGFATSTDNFAPPQPTFGTFFREQLEQLSGRPWDELVARGQDVIAAALRPQSVLQGNAPTQVDVADPVEGVHPQSTSQSNFPSSNFGLLENGSAENVVEFGFLSTANADLGSGNIAGLSGRSELPPGTTVFNGQIAQTSGSQAEELPLPPWFGPQLQRIGKNESLPEARVYYQNRMPATASRIYTHNYFDSSNRLVETSKATVRVPPGAWLSKRVAETGIPLGFETGEQFRRFKNLTVGAVRLAVQIRLGGDIARKIKVGIRGSAISGRKFVPGDSHRGIPFRPGSDLDIFIVAPEVIDRFHEFGGQKFKKTVKHIMIRRNTKGLERWGFDRIFADLSRMTGRKISLRVFRKGKDANASILGSGPSATLMFDLPRELK